MDDDRSKLEEILDTVNAPFNEVAARLHEIADRLDAHLLALQDISAVEPPMLVLRQGNPVPPLPPRVGGGRQAHPPHGTPPKPTDPLDPWLPYIPGKPGP